MLSTLHLVKMRLTLTLGKAHQHKKLDIEPDYWFVEKEIGEPLDDYCTRFFSSEGALEVGKLRIERKEIAAIHWTEIDYCEIYDFRTNRKGKKAFTDKEVQKYIEWSVSMEENA